MTFLLWLACVWAIWRVIRINKVLQAQNERIKTLEHTLAHLLKTTSQTTSATNTPSKYHYKHKITLTHDHQKHTPPHSKQRLTPLILTHGTHTTLLWQLSLMPTYLGVITKLIGISHAHPKTWHYPRTTRQLT